jgi:hypothetical protein
MGIGDTIHIAFGHNPNQTAIGIHHWQPADAMILHQLAGIRQHCGMQRANRWAAHPSTNSFHAHLQCRSLRVI